MKKLMVILAMIVGLAATGIAVASIPDSNGVIHGCYSNNGSLSVIDSATQSCSQNQTALNWNQTGPTGPTGPAGPQGPTGPQGPSGVVNGYEAQSDGVTASNASNEVEVARMHVPDRNSSGGSEEYFYSFNGLATATGLGNTTVECLVFGIDANTGNYVNLTTEPVYVVATLTGTEFSGSGVTNGLGFLSAPQASLEVKCQDNDGAAFTYQTQHVSLTLLPVQGASHTFDG